ncbi:MAG: protein phosphatase 2C domain-containing protein [Boseongicola sp.]|nr:protein phosphatase 2C domain-containing protein [Boseongicola sp.]NNJ68920.1 serine/threonine-protein phosphatase [Boseongicola sp.]
MTSQLFARYDVATALGQGMREIQEDAVVTDFPAGMDVGFVVLADGMGGHAAGEIASSILVTEVFAELKFKLADLKRHEAHIPAILKNAAMTSNACIRDYVSENPRNYGMGATLVAPLLVEDRLYWISVGDSPLYLHRDGRLQQLNEDHSMAPEIDRMVASGLLSPEEGLDHPDRNCLRSVLLGDSVAKIDCPQEPFQVQEGDIVLVASDGLQSLRDDEISAVLRENEERSATEIAFALLTTVNALSDPDQDNISISVIKVNRSQSASIFVPEYRSRRAAVGMSQTRLVPFSRET